MRNHSAGQESNTLSGAGGAETDAEFFAFQLAPVGSINVSGLTFDLSGVSGIEQADLTGAELLVDANGDGNIAPGETTAVGGAGAVSIDSAAGTITFSAAFEVFDSTNYILRADLNGLAPGETFSISLPVANITSDASNAGGCAFSVAHSVSGSLVLSDHSGGQESDKFVTAGSLDGAELFALQLTPSLENASIGQIVFDLTSISGIVAGDLGNVKLWRDTGVTGGDVDGSDTQLGGAGAVSVNGSTGTITFTDPFVVSASANYILQADVGDLAFTDAMTVSLTAGNITATGVTTEAVIAPSGSAANLRHSLGSNFTDVTAVAGLGGISNGYGVAWGDYNNDGFVDLTVAGNNQVYTNDGDGTFSAGPAIANSIRGNHWADFDNDGDLDFAASLDMYLSRNNDGETFTLQNNAGIGLTPLNNLGDVAWIDYNQDGLLDMWAPNGSSPYAYMFRNDGDGTFTAVEGDTIGLSADTNGETTIAADYDGDGCTDILYRGSSVYLWRNDGDGTFTNTTAVAGISLAGAGGGYNGTAFGDFDNDGDLDLYGGQAGSNKLYRNDGDGTFTDITVDAGVAGTALTTKGVAWGDYDNDGDLDLYVSQEGGANQFFNNNGDGTFTDAAGELGLNDSSNSYGAVWADYDLDGDVDLFVGNAGGASKLYRNNLDDSNYLKVKVTGAGTGASPADGTGARIELYDATGNNLLEIREVYGGEGMGSHSPRIQHFGLDPAWGESTGNYTIKAVFTSGETIIRSGVVPADCTITIGAETLQQTTNLNEVNHVPTIEDQSLGPIDENLANSTVVGIPAAFEPDAGDSLTWSITAGNTGSAFAIDVDTGEITVNNSSALDFETTTTFNLTVQVEDTGAFVGTAIVTIELNDLSDDPAFVRTEDARDTQYSYDMNAEPESRGPICPTVSPVLPGISDGIVPGPSPPTGQANPMLMLFAPGSIVPDEAAGEIEGAPGAVKKASTTPPQDAPNEFEDAREVTGEDRAVSSNGQWPVDTIRMVRSSGQGRRRPHRQGVQKDTDLETEPGRFRRRPTVSIVTGMVAASLAAYVGWLFWRGMRTIGFLSTMPPVSQRSKASSGSALEI